jgi:hypothetical protein
MAPGSAGARVTGRQALISSRSDAVLARARAARSR